MPVPSALIENVSGAIDGVNTIFTTPVPYVPGSLIVFLNGLAKRADLDDGWTELSSTSFQMKEAPVIGDVVQAYFRPQ